MHNCTSEQSGVDQNPMRLFTLQILSEFFILIEHTCAYARWAHMHCFLSVRLSVRLSVCLYVCPVSLHWHRRQTYMAYYGSMMAIANCNSRVKSLAGVLSSTSSCIFFIYSLLSFIVESNIWNTPDTAFSGQNVPCKQTHGILVQPRVWMNILIL